MNPNPRGVNAGVIGKPAGFSANRLPYTAMQQQQLQSSSVQNQQPQNDSELKANQRINTIADNNALSVEFYSNPLQPGSVFSGADGIEGKASGETNGRSQKNNENNSNWNREQNRLLNTATIPSIYNYDHFMQQSQPSNQASADEPNDLFFEGNQAGYSEAEEAMMEYEEYDGGEYDGYNDQQQDSEEFDADALRMLNGGHHPQMAQMMAAGNGGEQMQHEDGQSSPHQNNNNNTSDSFTSAEDILKSTADDTIKEYPNDIDAMAQQLMMQNQDKYFEEIIAMNDYATVKLQEGQQKEALVVLQKAERMLEFAASCGKVIDRNLIIVVLYNRACAYQSLWVLDKCSKYIDGVIYNLEISLKEEDNSEAGKSNNQQARAAVGSNSGRSQHLRKDSSNSMSIDREALSYKIRKQTFLVKSYLQCCAILSQQGHHEKALETANEGANVLKRIFSECYEFCRATIKEAEQANSQNTHREIIRNGSSLSMNKNKSTATASGLKAAIAGLAQPHLLAAAVATGVAATGTASATARSSSTLTSHSQEMMPANAIESQIGRSSSRRNMNAVVAKEEISFTKNVVEYAFQILSDVQNMIKSSSGSNQNNKGDSYDSTTSNMELFRETKKSLYFWKNNPENNERHIRQELNVPTKQNEEETRSILGVQNGSEWIESFNIGSIMHMVPVQYEHFSFIGDVIFEISKKQLLEKVIYLSISYFTIATEIRFIEIEKSKSGLPNAAVTTTATNAATSAAGSANANGLSRLQQQPNASNTNSPPKNNGMKASRNDQGSAGSAMKGADDSDGFRHSQMYHLKSIEIVCKHITCKSPYINHLITSYHKHYNQNLETILEESFTSMQDTQAQNHLDISSNPLQASSFNILHGSTPTMMLQNQTGMLSSLSVPTVPAILTASSHVLRRDEDKIQEAQRFEQLVHTFVNGMSEDDQTPIYMHLKQSQNSFKAPQLSERRLRTEENAQSKKIKQSLNTPDHNGSQSSRSQYSAQKKRTKKQSNSSLGSAINPSSSLKAVSMGMIPMKPWTSPVQFPIQQTRKKPTLKLDFSASQKSKQPKPSLDQLKQQQQQTQSVQLSPKMVSLRSSLTPNMMPSTREFFSLEGSKKNTPRGTQFIPTTSRQNQQTQQVHIPIQLLPSDIALFSRPQSSTNRNAVQTQELHFFAKEKAHSTKSSASKKSTKNTTNSTGIKLATSQVGATAAVAAATSSTKTSKGTKKQQQQQQNYLTYPQQVQPLLYSHMKTSSSSFNPQPVLTDDSNRIDSRGSLPMTVSDQSNILLTEPSEPQRNYTEKLNVAHILFAQQQQKQQQQQSHHQLQLKKGKQPTKPAMIAMPTTAPKQVHSALPEKFTLGIQQNIQNIVMVQGNFVDNGTTIAKQKIINPSNQQQHSQQQTSSTSRNSNSSSQQSAAVTFQGMCLTTREKGSARMAQNVSDATRASGISADRSKPFSSTAVADTTKKSEQIAAPINSRKIAQFLPEKHSQQVLQQQSQQLQTQSVMVKSVTQKNLYDDGSSRPLATMPAATMNHTKTSSFKQQLTMSSLDKQTIHDLLNDKKLFKLNFSHIPFRTTDTAAGANNKTPQTHRPI